MKLKNIEIINMNKAIGEMSEMLLPVKASFLLAKNKKKIEEECKLIEDERMKLIKKYGEKDSNGELIIQEDGTVGLVDRVNATIEINELFNLETEIDLVKISIDALGDIKISTKDLILLEPIIEE